MRRILLALSFALTVLPLAASEPASAPPADAGRLPVLGTTWLVANPYRQQAAATEAIALGRDAYNQACARCHGADASTHAAPAPDLRNLNRSCRRMADPDLKAWCQRDNDAYFAKTVRHGKIIVGVTHMPAWDGVLKQELAWAIQLFIEDRAAAK